jgi:acyl-CoA synthetase (AMP-forming)/AMP-acid ligase II
MAVLSPTIHGVLERNARKFPAKEAFVTPTGRFTYPEINALANQFARLLLDKGICSGERIALLAGNDEYFIVPFFALMKIGAIPAPVNIRCTGHELSAMVDSIRASGILYSDNLPGRPAEIAGLDLAHVYSIQELVHDVSGFLPNNLNLPIASADACEILFTSGTTGAAKGVLFNHERLLHLASAVSYEFGLSHQDKMLSLMPLSHSAPLNAFFLSGLYAGAAHVIGSYTPEKFLQLIDDERTTFTFAAPVAYLAAAKHPNLGEYNLSSMRVFAYGGGPMALAAYERVREAFQNSNFYQVYGLTEAGPNGSYLNPEEHLTKAGSIGRLPLINMELRVVREDGVDTVPGEYGEIILSGDTLMLGYDGNQQATDDAIRDGWLYTGDMGYRDEDNFVFVVDRKKNIIISGGVNIYPREVEEVLTKHPDVLECCVIGVPNADWGETVKAVIVTKTPITEPVPSAASANASATASEFASGSATSVASADAVSVTSATTSAATLEAALRAHVADWLADYKCPRIYQFVDELPHNASGKVIRQALKSS